MIAGPAREEDELNLGPRCTREGRGRSKECSLALRERIDEPFEDAIALCETSKIRLEPVKQFAKGGRRGERLERLEVSAELLRMARERHFPEQGLIQDRDPLLELLIARMAEWK